MSIILCVIALNTLNMKNRPVSCYQLLLHHVLARDAEYIAHLYISTTWGRVAPNAWYAMVLYHLIMYRYIILVVMSCHDQDLILMDST